MGLSKDSGKMKAMQIEIEMGIDSTDDSRVTIISMEKYITL